MNSSKIKLFLYILSLIIIFAATFLAVEYPDSGRLGLVAGILTAIGFSLNITSFAMANNENK